MMGESGDRVDAVSALLATLRGTEQKVPQGGLRRMARTAGAALGTGLSALSGRFRGREESGLGSADIKTIEKLVRNLGELKGIAMKMGQILSYIDETMPPEMRELLALLQTQSQPTPPEEVLGVIEESLGEKAGPLLSSLDQTPVSVASIGQVHRGRLPDGTEVAVKVRHPGMREALTSDFKFAAVGPFFARMMMPTAGATVKGFITEVRDRLLEECDFTLEAQRQERFRSLFAGHADVVIPRVHSEWSGDGVLTSTWEDGEKLETWLARKPEQAARDAIGTALFDFYFGNLYRHGLFHADPHPGNYAFRADGKVVVYDFGCTREFDKSTVGALSRLAHAVMADDESSIRAAFSDIGGAIPTNDKSFRHARKLLRGFFTPLLTPGPHRIQAGVNLAAADIMRDKRMLMRLQLPGKLVFLFRIRFGLYAVLSSLGANCDWRALELALATENGT